MATLELQGAVTARLRDARLPAGRRALPEVAHLGGSSAPSGPGPRELGGEVSPLLGPEAEVYAALVLGTRDYVEKNGFERVVLGLSGGIDSTLVALIAVDALGADRVTCVTMPSRYSSEGTRGDAEQLAANLGVRADRAADRAGDGDLRRVARAGASRAASPTSPRRTCRRASAATC